jgi:hypothetical protein
VARQVYSTRFIGITGFVSAPFVPLYTVPAGKVAVVKCITFVAGSNVLPGGGYVAIAAGPKLASFFDTFGPAGDLTHLFFGDWVANEGEVLGAGTFNWILDIVVSGYLLTKP